jgi:hypothetical protein
MKSTILSTALIEVKLFCKIIKNEFVDDPW